MPGRFFTQRDPRAFLWDVQSAADAIESFVRGRSFNDYVADLLLRSGVERQFEIIGEALNQLSKRTPEIASRLPQVAAIVAFRNVLIHGYAAVEHATVWRSIEDDLPQLRREVIRLLEELGGHA